MSAVRSATVAEAAEVLGITADAVRGRLHRGTLAGVKRRGVWYVMLDDVRQPAFDDESLPKGTERLTVESDTEQIELRIQVAVLTARLEGTEARLEQALAEVQSLREALERRDVLEQNRLKMQPALIADTSDTMQKRWWMFWR